MAVLLQQSTDVVYSKRLVYPETRVKVTSHLSQV